MIIHVVKRQETAFGIAKQYGIALEQLAFQNQLPSNYALVEGQALLILQPETTHQVRSGETLYSIAQSYQIPVMELIRNNLQLLYSHHLHIGQVLVITYKGKETAPLYVNGYAYPFVNRTVLAETLPYLSQLSIFSYGFTKEGNLIPIDEGDLIQIARRFDVSPFLVLTPHTEEDSFNNYLINAVVNNEEARNNLINNLLAAVQEKGYDGVDIDFEYVMPQDATVFAAFIAQLRQTLNAQGYQVSVALSPKIASNQPGLLYEGLNYRLIGEAANSVLLMTYEWGYTYGPPMAVAPIPNVRQVLDYAVTEIPPKKIDMGIPNYGYIWTMPFQQGVSKAKSVGNTEAVRIALENHADIRYDTIAQAPYFEYRRNGVHYVVWFEDVRSILAKCNLVKEYQFRGVGYWNVMRYFRENWLLLNNLFQIQRVN